MNEWNSGLQLLIVLHVLVALAVIGLVLLQHGKGADGLGIRRRRLGQPVRRTGLGQLPVARHGGARGGFLPVSLGLAYLATHKPARRAAA